MRQRVEGLSGTLQIESEPGGGTGISACLPADPPEVIDRLRSRLQDRGFLAVPEEEMRAAIDRYGLLDDQVVHPAGRFKDTLPTLTNERFAVVPLDGDMYESTMTALQNLYRRLSVGGHLIVDDYGLLESCRQAVADYRQHCADNEPIERIDSTGGPEAGPD